MRLMQEHGRNVRYNAPWKKWLVWNGAYWEVDESGALIHEKELLMVRNIYDELLITADYRERIEIEKYAILSENVRRREAFVKSATWIRGSILQATSLILISGSLMCGTGLLILEPGNSESTGKRT